MGDNFKDGEERQPNPEKIIKIISEALRAAGFAGASAKIIRIGEEQAPDIGNFENMLSGLGVTPNKEKDEEPPCLCKECFNFDTFEQVLKGKPEDYDYKTVELKGKKFDLKYYNGVHGERMMISPSDTRKEEVEELKTKLEIELIEALDKKDYDRVATILTALRNIKNSNK